LLRSNLDGKVPVVVVGASLEELMQLIKWFREAFDLPVLSVEEVDAQIAGQPSNLKSDHKGNILLSDVIAELSASDRSPLVQEE
jgi:acylphosphatase